LCTCSRCCCVSIQHVHVILLLANPKRLHTNDLHSHFEGIGPDAQLGSAHGHFARLKFLLNRLQQMNPNRTLTVDAGDHFSGTLFHLLSISDTFPCTSVPPVEFKFFSDAFYDAIIMGNHDFDGNEEGLLKILNCASQTTQVPILMSNMELEDKNPTCQQFKKLFTREKPSYEPAAACQQKRKNTHFAPYKLKKLYDQKTGDVLRVALIGAMGPDSAQCCTVNRKDIHFTGFNDTAGAVQWDDYVNLIYNTATKVRENYYADVVVLISHSGQPEDQVLVQSLNNMQQGDTPVIDVHISSHTHDVYITKIDKVYIHQAEALGTALGVLQFDFDEETRQLKLLNANVGPKESFYIDSFTNTSLLPHRISINADIPMDPDYKLVIERYKDLIDKTFLKNQDYKYETPVGIVPSRFTGFEPNPISGTYEFVNYLADCLYNETNNKIEELGEHKLDILIISSDAIRTDDAYFLAINQSGVIYQFSDVYRTLGIGTLSTTVSEGKLPGDVIGK
jgi:2',3'-cyclic-nucleotide 2'-phosphodiesterase (5'-nucleotidase family)